MQQDHDSLIEMVEAPEVHVPQRTKGANDVRSHNAPDSLVEGAV
jgi:hypothetical protein